MHLATNGTEQLRVQRSLPGATASCAVLLLFALGLTLQQGAGGKLTPARSMVSPDACAHDGLVCQHWVVEEKGKQIAFTEHGDEYEFDGGWVYIALKK